MKKLLISSMLFLSIVLSARTGYYLNVISNDSGYFDADNGLFYNLTENTTSKLDFVGDIKGLSVYKFMSTYFCAYLPGEPGYLVISRYNDLVVWVFICEEIEKNKEEETY